jgi:hypothetical protein
VHGKHTLSSCNRYVRQLSAIFSTLNMHCVMIIGVQSTRHSETAQELPLAQCVSHSTLASANLAHSTCALLHGFLLHKPR